MPTIDLGRTGPTEGAWATVCDRLAPFEWPRQNRLVVVSPHPDDETLGCGGLIATAAAHRQPVTVLAVTKGEASSGAVDLADIRAAELSAALMCLDPTGSVRCRHLGFADGHVSADVGLLADAIEAEIEATDLAVCPLADDGHPDHRAVSIATTVAAARVGAAVRWFPVWAWHCHRPARSVLRRGRRLDLTAVAFERKREAIECYRSQLSGADPVVPDWMLVRLCRPFEVLVRPR